MVCPILHVLQLKYYARDPKNLYLMDAELMGFTEQVYGTSAMRILLKGLIQCLDFKSSAPYGSSIT